MAPILAGAILALYGFTPYYADTPTFRQAWGHHTDTISAMDHWAGDLLRQKEEDGLAENTLVVSWGHQGLGMPRAKRYPYESGLCVPLLARWPSQIAPPAAQAETAAAPDGAPALDGLSLWSAETHA